VNKSVVVYGPLGCGKSTNANRIAAALGLTTIVDDYRFNRRKPPAAEGVLMLCVEDHVFEHLVPTREMPTTMSYPVAMLRVERHEAGYPVN
jgi:ABC-type thiamine transport system ATPase subunit